MAYAFSYRSIEEYHTLGFTVFRQILPPSLIADLRRVTEEARTMARDRSGAQAQRLQPIASYELDQQPFEDYAELPELVDAIARVLSPRHLHGNREILGVLLEPAELPWCTAWHRDWRDNMPGLDIPMWERSLGDAGLFNQVNCALYEDNCTWVVPGSHLRLDTAEEAQRYPPGAIPTAALDGLTYEERERAGLAYCRAMPGAARLCLDAGDFALYRNTMWHLGNYAPHLKRATLHDSADTPEFVEWRRLAQESRTKA